MPYQLAYLVISMAATAYSAYEQNRAARVAGRQQKYDAEYEAAALREEAKQEEFNREQARKLESRRSEKERRAMISRFAKSGEGGSEQAIGLISQQAEFDEINIQNADLSSIQRRKKLGLKARNRLEYGKYAQSAANAQGTAAIVAGVGSIAGQGYQYGSATTSIKGTN